jgi:hypothetical protein
MAESVDALVSNTNAARRAGSTPALGTQNPFKSNFEGVFAFFGKINYQKFCETKGFNFEPSKSLALERFKISQDLYSLSSEYA